MRYEILKNFSTERLCELVRAAIKEGWAPVGGAFPLHESGWFGQTMVWYDTYGEAGGPPVKGKR